MPILKPTIQTTNNNLIVN